METPVDKIGMCAYLTIEIGLLREMAPRLCPLLLKPPLVQQAILHKLLRLSYSPVKDVPEL